VLGEPGGELVEVVGQLDLAPQRPERLRNGTTALHRHQPGDGPSGSLNDDLLALLGKVNQPRELALGLVHSDANHDRKPNKHSAGTDPRVLPQPAGVVSRINRHERLDGPLGQFLSKSERHLTASA